jgi:hypothetical protein
MKEESELSAAELHWIESKVEANRRIWMSQEIQELDLTKAVNVDFWCTSLCKELICALAVFLKEDFGYETGVSVTDYTNGDALISLYQIQGSRIEVIVDPEYIDGWCNFMVRVCHEFGCQFTGWSVRAQENTNKRAHPTAGNAPV